MTQREDVIYNKKQVEEEEADFVKPRHFKSMRKKGFVDENNWMDALTTDHFIYHNTSPPPERTLEVTETLKAVQVEEDSDDVEGMMQTVKQKLSTLKKHDMFVAAGAIFAADVGIQKVNEGEIAEDAQPSKQEKTEKEVADVAGQEEKQSKQSKKEKKTKDVVETIEEVRDVANQEATQSKHTKKEKKNKDDTETAQKVKDGVAQEVEQPKHHKKEKKNK